jgi:hypothetical protein
MLNLLVHTCSRIDPSMIINDGDGAEQLSWLKYCDVLLLGMIYHEFVCYPRNLSGHSLGENHIDWLRADPISSAEK